MLGVLMTIMTAAYICPMTVSGAAMAMEQTPPSLCQSLSANTDIGGMAGCAGTHLAVIGQLLGDIPYTFSLLMALGLLALVFHLFSRGFLTAITRPLFSRFKHLYLYYRTSIKFLIEKKILRYLGLLGYNAIVSLV